MDKRTETALAVAQQALANITVILSTVKPNDEKAWYEVGRALGTAKMGLIESGASLSVPLYAVRKQLREATLAVGR